MKQPNLFTGAQLRDKGMKQAADHANEVVESWTDRAYSFLVAYLGTGPGEFMAEDVRRAANWANVPQPPSKRAWGAVIVRAKKAGLIERVGYRTVSNPKAHKTPATVWRVTL